MDRSPRLQEHVDTISKTMFGRVIDGRTCVFCGKPLGEFRDDLSRKEADISGICQICQDETFG